MSKGMKGKFIKKVKTRLIDGRGVATETNVDIEKAGEGYIIQGESEVIYFF